MHNSTDSQPVASLTPVEEVASTEAHNLAGSARKPFVEPVVSAATDILEVTQNFAQVTGSGNVI
jgi:hypothetical protein